MPPALSGRIDHLDGVTINNPTIVGGSVSGTSGVGGSGGIGDNASTTTFFSAVGHFTTGIIDALSSAAGTINDLTSNTITATNVAFTNATTTNFAATSASTTNLTTGSLTVGSATGVLYATGGVVSAIANSADGKVLKLSGGVPTWGTDSTGSGGGSSIFATTTDSLAAYLSPASTVLLIGSSATTTTGNILEVSGNSLFHGTATAYKTVTAPSFTATSTTASQLPYASTTAITASYASSTSGFFGSLSVGALSGFLKATAGVISSALVDLTTNVTGTLSVANGGTGSTTLSGILKGNGTSQVATAVGGTDYELPLTFNGPLSRAGNAISLSTSGDWSGTLAGLTAAQLIAAGFSTTSADAWKATRSFFATTSADYWKTQNQFFSTTSVDAWKTTRSFFATTSDDYFLSQRTADNLAQGSSNKYYATSLFAADLAATTTDALAQGSTNKYWSNTLFDARLSATTSLPNIITLASLSLSATQLTNFGNPFYSFFHATTTDALTQGTTNKYYSTQLFAADLGGTTTTALAEGNNKYYTDERGDDRISSLLQAGTGINLSYDDAGNALTISSTGGGGGTDVNFSYFNGSAIRPATSTNQVLIGGTSTTSASKLQVIGGATIDNASTTNITSTYASSTQGFFGNLSIGNFSGFLKATAGVISSALVDLTSNVTGTLPVANGGTGSTTLSGILKGNGTSQIATAVGGTDYELPLTFNGPLSRAGNAISLSTSGDWTGTLGSFTAAQLIAAGFSTTSADVWKSNRSFFATTSNDYWKTQTDFFATTSADAWKTARSFFGTTSSDYWLTQKTTDNLTQGAFNKYYATSLFAADLAATTTDALAQGSTNKYWSNSLFDTRLSATTSLPGIITLASLSLPATQLTNFGNPFFQYFSATTTSALTEGSNLYYTDERVDDRVSSLLQAGSGINLSYNDGANTLTISATGGGGGTDVNWAYFNGSAIRPATSTNQVLIGMYAVD